jgi:5-dehydro-4-deoxyglucarate dehydratase
MPLSPEQLKPRLEGVFGFPITPFHADGSLNVDALRRHVGWMAGTGISTIFVCAGTGEFAALALEEYRAAVGAAVKEVAGRVPVLAGVGYSTAIACQFAREAERAGADGVLALPPYLVVPEQEGLYRHYRQIAESVGVGLLLYHRDNALFAPDTVARLAELPNLVGFKDGCGNLEQFNRTRLAIGDRLAWINGMPTAEMTFPAFHACGARAFTSATSNFIPHVTLRFYHAVVEGDRETVDAILTTVIEPLCRLRDRKKGYAISYVKAAVTLMGRLAPEGAGPVRPPLVDLAPAEVRELRDLLDSIQERWPLKAKGLPG